MKYGRVMVTSGIKEKVGRFLLLVNMRKRDITMVSRLRTKENPDEKD